jgi:urease beta subunit
LVLSVAVAEIEMPESAVFAANRQPDASRSMQPFSAIRPGAATSPGQTRDVTLIALTGGRTVYGFRQDVMGKL